MTKIIQNLIVVSMLSLPMFVVDAHEPTTVSEQDHFYNLVGVVFSSPEVDNFTKKGLVPFLVETEARVDEICKDSDACTEEVYSSATQSLEYTFQLYLD